MSETDLMTVPEHEVWAELQADTMEAQEYAAMSDDERLATWFLGVYGSLDDMEARIKAQSKAMLHAIEMRRMAMAKRFGPSVRQAVDHLLAAQKGKPKKSITLLTGKAGYRMKPGKAVIEDAKSLADWCSENCPDALEVVVQRTTPIKDRFLETGEQIPGFRFVPESNEFFPAVHPQAFGAEMWPGLESEKENQE